MHRASCGSNAAGMDFSLREVLFPLPAAALPVMLDVLAHVPLHLCKPFMELELVTHIGPGFTSNDVSNALTKLQMYLGGTLPSPADQAPSARLKSLQAAAPSDTICEVCCGRTSCPCGRPLALQPARDRHGHHVPASFRGHTVSRTGVTRFWHIHSMLERSWRPSGRGIVAVVNCSSSVVGNTKSHKVVMDTCGDANGLVLHMARRSW